MTIRLKILLLATVPLIIIIIALSILMKFQYEKLSSEQISAYQTSLYTEKDTELRNYTQLALSAISPYLNDSNLDKETAQRQAKAVLTSMEYSNDGYFFVYDFKGDGIVHPTQPYRVGKNWLNLKDSAGNPVIQDLIELSKQGGGFYTYSWNNPATNADAEKRSYTLPVEEWDWFIGTGIYLDKIDAQIAQQKAEFNTQIRQSLLRNAAFASLALLSVFALVFYMNFHELGHADKRLRILNNDILNAQEDERRRVSRELHDSISQMLISSKFAVEHASLQISTLKTKDNSGKLYEIQIGLQKGISKILETAKEVRRISHALRPSQLDDLGLGPALENLANDFEERTNITTSVTAPRFKGSLPDDTKIVLYRICQEALTNIHRHAQASHVEITVLKAPESITLKVEDDGVGFDSSTQKTANGSVLSKAGLGLTNMHERIESRQGKIELSSNKDGTHLIIELPVTYLPTNTVMA